MSLLTLPVGQRQLIGRERGREDPDVKQLRFEYIATTGIISPIIIGLMVGAIAKFLMPRKDLDGWIITILIGLAGSFLGPIGQTVGLYRTGEPAGFNRVNLWTIILSPVVDM